MFWGSPVCLVVLLLFVLLGSVFVSFVCVHVSLFLFLFDYTFYHLSGVLLVFIFQFPLLLGKATYRSWFFDQKSGLGLWGGSTESRTLDD